jgi:prolyl-tRNA editing enzyme YbaK/EbsC (Cys-tRNA(Pro) deacylase)
MEAGIWQKLARVKTNAARSLDSLGIAYELRDYDPSDDHLPAEEVARRVGLPAERSRRSRVTCAAA